MPGMVVMLRRQFVFAVLGGLASAGLGSGCRSGKQTAHVLKPEDQDLVGSHAAGAETWKPLVDTAVCQLLERQAGDIRTASGTQSVSTEFEKKRICFAGVENRSAEEIGDFKEQIYDHIDTMISQSDSFEPVHRRYIDAGMVKSGLRPDDIFVPSNQRKFTEAMERINQPFDYMLYAKITTGTTKSNKDTQRDYELVLELIDIHSGDFQKETASLRKGYHKSKIAKLKAYGA
jgi:hypothetical protein